MTKCMYMYIQVGVEIILGTSLLLLVHEFYTRAVGLTKLVIITNATVNTSTSTLNQEWVPT